MISSSPLRPRRLPLFGLAAALFSLLLTYSVPVLFGLRDLPMGVYSLRSVTMLVAAVLVAPLLGTLVDRARSRRTAVVALALVGAVALAAATGAAQGPDAVSGPVITAVLVTMSAVTALAPVGEQAYLPSIVGRDRLVTANAVLHVLPLLLMMAIGAALSWADGDGLTLAVAVGVAAACAAAAYRGVQADEEPPLPRTGLWRETMEGLRFTFREPVLRAIALCVMVTSLTGGFAEEMEGAARGALADYWNLSLSMMVTLYGATALGALVAVLLHRRLGAYRLAIAALLASQPFILLLALSGGPGGWWWYTLGNLVPTAGLIVVSIALLSHRQAITPDRLLGRVGGTLVALVMLGEIAGTLLRLPGDWLAEDASSPLPLLTGLVLATALGMAAAVPLLRARHLATTPREPESALP
ncbi:MFS transporter [Nonomuraea sp. PA05]|uniref:MFS transporter n=1 Tax=Nonomuraea sp. PA05 TaxID=2604466 RepID=UPI0011D5D342|nr:MFS transporter [Nonomuraea sp. PA05]TYB62805.1 MFS transporter [Nonomuraea sp. PA05]